MKDARLCACGLVLCLSAALAGCGNGDDDDTGSTGGNSGSGASGGMSAEGGSGGSGAGGTSASGGSSGGSGASGGTSNAGTSNAGTGNAGASDAGKGGAAGKGSKGGTGGGTAGSSDDGGSGDTGPAPSPTWTNVTGNLANMQSECGNLTMLSATPDSDMVIAGVAHVGVFATTDGGAHWDELGTGAGSATIINRPSSIVYDPDHAGTFWETGIYNGGGLYETTDDGAAFEQLGSISHNDLVSVDFTDPDRKTLLVGGHEQKQTLYLSTDGGQSFDQIGMNLPSDSHFSSAPLVIDSKTFLLGACGYGDGTCGVYRSEDTGATWTHTSDLPVQARPLWASDGSIYWSLIYNGGIARSTDLGKTWMQMSNNVVTAYPVELPDGRILTLSPDHVIVSSDHGATWTNVGDPLPFMASGVVYSVKTKTLFIWHWDCGTVVLPDAIASAGFDYTEN